MLEGRTFGIPKREVKVDPYVGQSLLIMHPAPAEAGKTFKFELTKLAVEQLQVNRENNLDEKLVSFSFGEENILIANTTSMKDTIDSKSQYNVSMDGNFSNKNAHDYITNILGLDPTQEYKFQIIMDEDSQDFQVAIINLITPEVIAETTEIETVEDTTDTQEAELATEEIAPEIQSFENESPE